MILVWGGAFLWGMAAAIPMGPVGTLLLRVPARRWLACLAALFVLDLSLASGALLLADSFLAITSSGITRFLAGAFLLIFAIRGLRRQKKCSVDSPQKFSTVTIFKVLTVAASNPGTYLMIASAFVFMSGAQNDSFGFRLGIMAALSLGAVCWYHLVRMVFLKQSAQVQLKIERVLFMVVGLIGTFTLLASLGHNAQAASNIDCSTVARSGASVRQDCRVAYSGGSKIIHSLSLEGDGAQISYDHGYLLAEESERGVISQTDAAIDAALNKGSAIGRPLKRKVFECLMGRVQSSLGSDYLDDVKFFHQGYATRMRQLGKTPRYSHARILRASLAIELSIIMDGMGRKAERSQLSALAELTANCGVRIPLGAVGDLVNILNPFGPDGLKMGCIGGVLPAAQSASRSLMHIRNLDADMVETWNRHPVIALVKRRGSQPFVAGATAGLVYLGGISGFNQSGISASIHQMSTERYQTRHVFKKGMLAPYMMQKILEKASTLDEAISLIKSNGRFGAWTLLLADAKTGEAASVELSGENVSVARRTQNMAMPQSNHFLSDKMKYDYFTFSFNKYLESWSRFYFMDRSLKSFGRHRATVEDLVNILSGHQDQWEGRRAFGRTATKAYTVMSTIAVPGTQELWVTLGERMPASHSNFVGFYADFARGQLIPKASVRTSQYAKISSWESSLGKYVQARVAYVGGDTAKSVALLKSAKALAAKSGINEPVYSYILGRLYQARGEYALAANEFRSLEGRVQSLHEYGRGMLYFMQAVNVVHSGQVRDAKFKNYLVQAQSIFAKLQAAYPHEDLDKKQKLLTSLAKGRSIEVPKIDFVTVE